MLLKQSSLEGLSLRASVAHNRTLVINNSLFSEQTRLLPAAATNFTQKLYN
jgi:hypothetical protein